MSDSSGADPADRKLARLALDLAGAHRNPVTTVPASRFIDLTVEEAMRVQALTLGELGETAPVTKVAIAADGEAVAAPVYRSLTAQSGGRIQSPKRGIDGVEVEIAVRLARAITPEMAERGAEGVLPAIAGFHVGIEIIGSRLDDRKAAGPNGPLADNLVTAGYVWSEVPWSRGLDISDIEVTVEIDGRPAFAAKGVHPFGGVLEPIIAYARRPLDGFGALAAGRIITTGSLCGLVPLGHPARIRGAVDGETVELELG